MVSGEAYVVHVFGYDGATNTYDLEALFIAEANVKKGVRDGDVLTNTNDFTRITEGSNEASPVGDLLLSHEHHIEYIWSIHDQLLGLHGQYDLFEFH